ncbi:hypothetical protein Q2375_25940, partial [Escherichia coli]|nr:hypothetical protein [Escherichia coli]
HSAYRRQRQMYIRDIFYAAEHHATDRGGIRALSEWMKENTDLDVTFIDIPNPE